MWKPASTVTGQIVSFERLNSSVNGNPRYEIFVQTSDRINGDWLSFTTSSDSACAYDVENVYNSQAMVTFGLTRAYRVSTITREK